jgi:predicted esterase
LAGYVQAYNYWVKTYNLDKLAFVYGFSMGGLTALSLMKGRMIPMRCAMIGAPVISIYNQCVERPSTPNPNFLSAYGISAYDRSKLYGCDRYHDIVQIGQTNYAFPPLPPLYIAYGESDVNISNEKIQEYYEALYNANHMVRIKGYTGGHEISYGGNLDVIDDMVNWFNAYKG